MDLHQPVSSSTNHILQLNHVFISSGFIYLSVTSSGDLLIGRTMDVRTGVVSAIPPACDTYLYIYTLHRCITTQLSYTSNTLPYLLRNHSMGRVPAHALKKPLEIIWVNARCDAMSEICDPPSRWAGCPNTKRGTHATHAIFDCFTSAI
jgi:hypothetical protein